jgi:hypothetical protein
MTAIGGQRSAEVSAARWFGSGISVRRTGRRRQHSAVRPRPAGWFRYR